MTAPSPQSSIDKTILAQVRAANLPRLMGLVGTVQQAIAVTKTNTGGTSAGGVAGVCRSIPDQRPALYQTGATMMTTNLSGRREYEMSEEDYKALLDACKPTPAMYLSGGQLMFGTPQENANAAWKRLGEKMGFLSMSVQPVRGKPPRVFSAIPATEENTDEAH